MRPSSSGGSHQAEEELGETVGRDPRVAQLTEREARRLFNKRGGLFSSMIVHRPAWQTQAVGCQSSLTNDPVCYAIGVVHGKLLLRSQ